MKSAGGGTISVPHRDLKAPNVAFEDGTMNFHGILALRHGFAALSRVGGMESIQRYLQGLTQFAIKRISELLHSNGAQLCRLYRRETETASSLAQGPIIAFNVFQASGKPVGFEFVAKRASLRVICF
jgi:molybdenum cofactor sulfurtransferase